MRQNGGAFAVVEWHFWAIWQQNLLRAALSLATEATRMSLDIDIGICHVFIDRGTESGTGNHR